MSFYKNWITRSIPETCRRRPRHHGDLDMLNGEVGVESCGLVDPRVGAGCSRKTNELEPSSSSSRCFFCPAPPPHRPPRAELPLTPWSRAASGGADGMGPPHHQETPRQDFGGHHTKVWPCDSRATDPLTHSLPSCICCSTTKRRPPPKRSLGHFDPDSECRATAGRSGQRSD